MDWIRSKVRKHPSQPNADDSSRSSSTSSWCPCDAPCSLADTDACSGGGEHECHTHQHIPAPMANKIDQDDPEFPKSVKKHHKHLLICQGSDPARWTEDISDTKGCYAQVLDDALSRASESGVLGCKVRLSLSDRKTYIDDIPVEGSDAEEVCDILILPDQILVHTVDKTAITQFVETFANWEKECRQIKQSTESTSSSASASSSSSSTDNQSSTPLPPFPMSHSILTGTFFLVCCHKLRDKRCGTIGPMIISEIDATLQAAYPTCHPNQQDPSNKCPEVHTIAISHVGGHKFAGIVIVYPPGVWYGRLIPCHVPHLLTAHVPNFLIKPEERETGQTEQVWQQRAEGELKKLRKFQRGHVEW